MAIIFHKTKQQKLQKPISRRLPQRHSERVWNAEKGPQAWRLSCAECEGTQRAGSGEVQEKEEAGRVRSAGEGGNAKRRQMQRMVERQERVVRLAEGEFCKLRKRRFESMEEFVHAVDAEQPQLLHESATIFRACEAERLARRVGLPCGDHAAHHERGVEV